MKKIVCVILSVLLLAACSGCSSGVSEADYIALKNEYSELRDAYDEMAEKLEGLDALEEELQEMQGVCGDLQKALQEVTERLEDQAAQMPVTGQPEDGQPGETPSPDGGDTGKASGGTGSSGTVSGGTGSGTSSGGSTNSGGSAATDTSQPEGGSSGTMVWVTETGSKYHSTSTCSGMKSPKQIPLETALAQGYTACKRCH